MKPWQDYEMQARRAIEDRGFTVLDANIVFRANCPNIDAIVFGRRGASYVQIKSSTKPAGADTVVVDGSVWTREQLYESASIYNKHSDDFLASLVVIVHKPTSGETEFYIAPPRRDREASAAARPRLGGSAEARRHPTFNRLP